MPLPLSKHLGSLILIFVLSIPALPQSTAGKSASEFAARLRDVRSALRIDNGKLAGEGARVLEDSIRQAKYVLIGEDHLTREVPQFAAAICDVMAPQGLSDMVVETGPHVTAFLAPLLGKPERLAKTRELLKTYPDSVAFLNMRQENDLVSHCAGLAKGAQFHLWGLDQEFLGSAGWLLDQIIATRPSPRALAAITKLREQEKEAAARAKQTGDPSQVLLLSVSDDELRETADLLQQGANGLANRVFSELVMSHNIYLENSRSPSESNGMRARLLKQNFKAVVAEGPSRPQKILVKFGDWHLYKGFNPRHQRDLGNYIAELADAEGTNSLHICVLGIEGTHRLYAGYMRPMELKAFQLTEDPDYRWLEPIVEQRLSDGWTLFDLRKLRFAPHGSLDPAIERFLYGYDLLVLAPEFSPADLIE